MNTFGNVEFADTISSFARPATNFLKQQLQCELNFTNHFHAQINKPVLCSILNRRLSRHLFWVIESSFIFFNLLILQKMLHNLLSHSIWKRFVYIPLIPRGTILTFAANAIYRMSRIIPVSEFISIF